jgi:hypothetical protein
MIEAILALVFFAAGCVFLLGGNQVAFLCFWFAIGITLYGVVKR